MDYQWLHRDQQDCESVLHGRMPRLHNLIRKTPGLFCDQNLSVRYQDLSFCNQNRLGLVVKAFASRAEDPGFESHLRRDFSRSSYTSDLKIGTPVATLTAL